MCDIIAGWLHSAKYILLFGKKLKPLPHPSLPNSPLMAQRGQAEVLFLKEEGGSSWVLKRFKDGQAPDQKYLKSISGILPRHKCFSSGTSRAFVKSTDLIKEKKSYYNKSLSLWMHGTILMPRVEGSPWAMVADEIRDNQRELSPSQRIILCQRLSEIVALLEIADSAHRDLSSGNLFVQNDKIELIDFDSLYHPALRMPLISTSGTDGYIASFVYKNGTPDIKLTWSLHADRFALTLLNAEFLCLEKDTPLTGDGGMFDQNELLRRSGPSIDRTMAYLKKYPVARSLLESALKADSYDCCPSPAEWLKFSASSHAVPLQLDPSNYMREVLKKRLYVPPAPRLSQLPDDKPSIPSNRNGVSSQFKRTTVTCFSLPAFLRKIGRTQKTNVNGQVNS